MEVRWEVIYIVKELWHGRSARDHATKDVGRGIWDAKKPASVSNLILLKFKEADEHEAKTLEEVKEREAEFFEKVSCVLKKAEQDFYGEKTSQEPIEHQLYMVWFILR
ncbi:hypothetical protein AALP_AA6G358200 [Arabis alpina]|uniref:Uncharacterized protein n=1 Tax=Arabis alpina TaxID=50452 RepID=A0A087GTV6_ARAAL|nr:hypothetical protein AALP_AA6G358200 [Arabis alpina]